MVEIERIDREIDEKTQEWEDICQQLIDKKNINMNKRLEAQQELFAKDLKDLYQIKLDW
jgi:hypothetical protein